MKKSTIALLGATVVCLGLSVFSVKASVTRVNDAIAQIGEVSYSEACKERIDRAVDYYNALDDNFNLKEQVADQDTFEAAKLEYARLAIKAASVAKQRQKADGYSADDIRTYVEAAREVVNSYLTPDEYSQISNYGDLTSLESEYAASAGSAGAVEEVSIPMC